VREALHGWENKETKKRRNHKHNNGGFSRVKKTFAGAKEKSTNRTRPDEALDETNAAVLSDSTDNAQFGSNCSSELSPELEPPRTSASNTGS
jgi:hypothetical protein